MEDFNLLYTFVPHLENHGETEEIDWKFSSLTVNLPVSTSTEEAAQKTLRSHLYNIHVYFHFKNMVI